MSPLETVNPLDNLYDMYPKSLKYLFLGLLALNMSPLSGQSDEAAALNLMQERLIDSYSEFSNPIVARNHMEALDANGRFEGLSYRGLSDYQEHIERTSLMVQVYYQSMGNLTGDPDLYAAAVSALDRWLTDDYIDSNWWWTYIGFPKDLVPVTSLMGRELRTTHPAVYQKLINYHYRIHDYFLRNPHGWGANVADMGYLAAVGAVVDRRASKLTSIVEDSFEEVLKVIPHGDNSDGIRIDQTIFSHGPQLYNATYGREFLNSSIRAIDLLKDTPWDQGEEAVSLVENQLLGGIRNMSYGSWMDYNTTGRAISRPGSDELAVGFTSIIKTLLELEPEHPGQLSALLTRIEEDAVEVHESAKGIHNFYYGDFLTRHGDGYYTSVRMVSERTSYNEAGNGEGLKNAHFGDGVNLTLVHGDEYDKMSVLWDYEQLPGITAEHNGTETKGNAWADMGKSPYAGNATRNELAVSAMGLEHDDVLGWKSWFMLEEGVVALGSRIRSPEGSRRTSPWMPVVSTVNFTKFEDSVSYGSDDAESGTLTVGEETNLDGRNWVWHRDIGYLILEESGIAEAAVEARSGNWSEIGTSSGRVEGNAFKLYFDHGAEPENGGYAYMTLPNTDKARTQTLAENPPMEILRRDEGVHAVKVKSDGTVLAAFFKGGETLQLAESGSVTVEEPILMLIERTSGLYDITVSDPRKALDSVILTLSGELEGEGAVYDATSESTTIEMELPSGNRTGASVTQRLKDTGDPAGEWGAYFQDISYSNEDMDFFSERFGWFNGEDWPWLWSFEYEKFWFVVGASNGGDSMIWWDPDQEAWVFTNSIFYPWYYNFRSQDWGAFSVPS